MITAKKFKTKLVGEITFQKKRASSWNSEELQSYTKVVRSEWIKKDEREKKRKKKSSRWTVTMTANVDIEKIWNENIQKHKPIFFSFYEVIFVFDVSVTPL